MFKSNRILKQGTMYGVVSIENIAFSPDDIESILPKIILEEDNLKYMFAEQDLDNSTRKRLYARFIPTNTMGKSIEDYVDYMLVNNRVFYSFLAEGLLTLVYRDLCGYNLAAGVIDINETLSDTHTGVDACMYDLGHKKIILGEAKFYSSFDQGINAIINDFVNKNITNKLESLQRKAGNCEEAAVIIKNLTNDDYEDMPLEDFLNLNISFAGFVLHSENDIHKYLDGTYYDNFPVSIDQIENNIKANLGIGSIKGNYSITLIHLPIKSKKQLIKMMIKKSKEEIERIRKQG